MARYFNTEGSCRPEEHYMVRLDERLGKIKRTLVDRRKYFVINRGRQYGKTTMLNALEKYLKEDYLVLTLDFQEIETAGFANGAVFSRILAKKTDAAFRYIETEDKERMRELLQDFINGNPAYGLDGLFECFSSMCEISSRPIVLMIDEVDSAGNHQVFLDFLSLLRAYYLKRDKMPVFHSVILAGVYSIKNLKLKLRPEAEHQYNSPWNIAADFDIDMNFSPMQISGMLEEYEDDYHTGMDTRAVAEEIYAYTSGYPVLVSLICKRINEKIAGSAGYENMGKAWTKKGVKKAVTLILKESQLLFESMAKQLDTYEDLYRMTEDIIYRGKQVTYSPEQKSISLGVMFGFLKEENGHVAIANRMFEMRLLNLFMAEEAGSDAYVQGGIDRIGFIKNHRLDMDLVLKKFVDYFTEICSGKDTKFIEKYGRKMFLLYLKPIINGTGNYYLEAQTRDERRTDVIVDYLGEQFVVELKIWHGNEYNERGREQLLDYLEYYHKDKGYLLSFNFNKNKKIGVREITIDSKTIVEAVV